MKYSKIIIAVAICIFAFDAKAQDFKMDNSEESLGNLTFGVTTSEGRVVLDDSFQDRAKDLPELSGMPEIQALTDIEESGGVEGSFAKLALNTITEIHDFQRSPEFTDLDDAERSEIISRLKPKLIKSEMVIITDLNTGFGAFDISTKKKCISWINCLKKYRNPDRTEWEDEEFTKRWVIKVDAGGLEEHETPGDAPWNHLIYAEGQKITLLKYFENEYHVRRFIEGTSTKDPRFNYYTRSDDACIHIKLKERPDNGTIVTKPGDLKFCAGGCALPGVDATNGA